MVETTVCSRATCKLAETGVCENNYSIVEECPDVTTDKSIQASSENMNNDQLPENEDTGRLFYHGEALSLSDADAITRETPTQIIILAGEISSGKTTLLAEIYDQFQNGPFAGFLFSGSRTLLGFEQRCHSARIASGKSKSETERTKVIDPELLHLVVKKKQKNIKEVALLFTDISGERFKMVRDSSEECKKLEILARADHFAMLINGSELIDRKNRHKSYEDCRALLRSTLDAEMLGKDTSVEILFSKWDLIQPKRTKTTHSEFVSWVKDRLQKEFEHRFRDMSFFEIASRPLNTKKYPLGFNLEIVFQHWVNDRQTE